MACQSNLRQIGQAINIYVIDNKGTLPYGYWNGSGNSPTSGIKPYWGSANAATPDYTKAADWTTLIQNDLNGSISSAYNSGTSSQQQTMSRLRQVFLCPSAPEGPTMNPADILYQYACHPRLMPVLGSADMSINTHPATQLFPYKIADIQHSSDIALIFDASLVELADGAWRVDGDPVGTGLNEGNIYWTGNFADLTNQWNVALSQLPPTLSKTGFLSPSDPVYMASNWDQNGGNRSINVDDTPGDNSAGGEYNPFNIRYRHLRNTTANVLMVDGHVDSFTFNPKTLSNTLLAKNIFVNPVP